jgi:hypothetical protein
LLIDIETDLPPGGIGMQPKNAVKPKHVVLIAVVIALLWFGFFWNPIIAVMGVIAVILVSAVTSAIK